ncbi:MAG: ABC transporter ATP-binding protein [Oscillatoriales cyanobacterium SM2_1_8]|nr:ABC transporter ATP-binding protein [Oscillatoriales cyanobacterium SM2_1_8]
MDILLQADRLSKRFGGLQAVSEASITIERGQIVGLIGPNGAGKTTFFNLLSNFLTPDGGTVVFNGRPIHRLPPHQIARLGMVRTFQIPKALSRLTVLENLLLGAQNQIGEGFWHPWLRQGAIHRQQEELRAKAETILESVGLGPMGDAYAGSLSGGQRKLLEMARTLMADPQLILLDEPAAGVNPALIEAICDHIQRWNRAGLSFLIVEHNMDVIQALCDRVWVMAGGRNLMDGPPAAVRRSPAVLEAYLGSD